VANLTDLSDIINRVTGGSDGTPEHLFWYKDNRIGAAAATTHTAGRLNSLWQYNGQPCGGAVPGAAAAPTNATNGSMRHTNPGGSREKWLLGLAVVSSLAGTLFLYDRLLHCGGLDGTVTTPQTVGGALTRNTGGEGNQIWVEIYTQIGTTARTITASYTNQAGTAGRTTEAAAIGGTGSREATRLIRLPLASGDTGVRSVESVTLSDSTGTAGEFGVTITKEILLAPLPNSGVGTIRDCIAGLPSIMRIEANACLALAWMPLITTVPQLFGSLHFVEK
jgi:hypothetical protein